jgi:hypothetical protein
MRASPRCIARIIGSTAGSVDGRSLVLTALLLAAGVQLLRRQFFGPAVPLWCAGQALGGFLPKQQETQVPEV